MGEGSIRRTCAAGAGAWDFLAWNTTRRRPASIFPYAATGRWAPWFAPRRRRRINMPFSIVLVDDHKLVRDGVRTILERGAEFRVVGEAESGSDAVALCR